ncbi:hypothetical protein BDR26DRAFT_836988 [Obelidium mucronatum]|nr:hypothetical protein BDR26DRAFT_836988 [Obelidium mucronatum]
MALQKLAIFYNVTDIDAALHEIGSVPGPRSMSAWNNKNKLGFLKGILTLPPDKTTKIEYASKFFWTFGSLRLPAPDTAEEASCLELLYYQFIHPFKQLKSRNKNSTESVRYESPPPTPGGSESTGLAWNTLDPGPRNFTTALLERDKDCLFCWTCVSPYLYHETAHLIGQRQGDPLTRTGLDSIYRVQNGVLICDRCRYYFRLLRLYIDVVDNHDVVNPTNDPEYKEFRQRFGLVKATRFGSLEFLPPGRTVFDENNELTVYFADSDSTNYPNRAALALHKSACLIWKMAGAGNDVEDYLIDDINDIDGCLANVCTRLRNLDVT